MKISLRMQGIQKYLLKKKHEDMSPENVPINNPQSRTAEGVKFAPVLSKSITKRSKLESKDRRSQDTPSKSFRDTSPLVLKKKLFSTTSSQFIKTSKPVTPLLISNSLEVIQNAIKVPVPKAVSPQKVVKKKIQSSRVSLAETVAARERSQLKQHPKKSRMEVERIWRKSINNSNGIEPLISPSVHYTVYVGKGNNSPMIKKLFASRSWWKIIENKELANFVWSQWKDKQVISDLKCFQEQMDKNAVCLGKASIRINDSEIDQFGLGLIKKSKSYVVLPCEKFFSEHQKLHNKLEFNQCLTNKKGLYATMKLYYESLGLELFAKVPMTFNVTSEADEEYQKFLQIYQEYESEKTKGTMQNIWIIKPGEYTNRGNGITVCQALEDINAILKPAPDRSFIIQKYIEKPLLIYKRKFDIRCYAMITSINGVVQGYFYLDGYLRTTSKEYTCKEISNPLIHLTNDAIQKHSAEYGKFENGNKMSYREFQRYLDHHLPEKKVNFIMNILPEIKDIVRDTMKASFQTIDKNKRMHCMEVFGYDFMIDREFKPWLIEINTNPCLELASPYLRTIIPAMVENALRITADSIFPPPVGVNLDCASNRFELIFHQNVEGFEYLDLLRTGQMSDTLVYNDL